MSTKQKLLQQWKWAAADLRHAASRSDVVTVDQINKQFPTAKQAAHVTKFLKNARRLQGK